MYSAADHARLDSILRRSKRLGCCSDDQPAVADLFFTADGELFHRVKSNSNNVLHPYLPSNTDISYQLHTRFHRMTLINKTKHLLYKHSYKSLHSLFYVLFPFIHSMYECMSQHRIGTFNVYFNCYYSLLLPLGSLMFYMFGCIWQPSINEHDDDDDDDGSL